MRIVPIVLPCFFAIAFTVGDRAPANATNRDLDHDANNRTTEMTEEAAALRVMKTVHDHAKSNDNRKAPVFSPWESLLAEGPSELFDVQAIGGAGYPVVTWTVNDPRRMVDLMRLGVDGIISDRPDLLRAAVAQFDPGLIGPDGLVDIDRMDIQGHRGARDLRPENTLPAMEAGLDHSVTTLETDTGVTADGVSVLSHDPYLTAGKCRRADGDRYDEADEVLIKNLSVRELQSEFRCDGLVRGELQSNDLQLSPVSVAFSDAAALPHPYVTPTLANLFDFVTFYADYYRSGGGASHPDAEHRWKNAARVRFNIETKLDPRGGRDDKGLVFAERTVGPRGFVDALAGTISARGLHDRADIQSFDFRTLLLTHEQHPMIRTVFLFGAIPTTSGRGDGANFED